MKKIMSHKNVLILLIAVFCLIFCIYYKFKMTPTDPIEKARKHFGPFIVDYFQLDFPNKYNGIDLLKQNTPVYSLTEEENQKVLRMLKETISHSTMVKLTYYLDDEGYNCREYLLDSHTDFTDSLGNLLNANVKFQAPPAGCIVDRTYYMDFTFYPSGLRLHFMLADWGLGPSLAASASMSLTMGPETVQELWIMRYDEMADFCLTYPVKDNLSCKQLKQRDYQKMNVSNGCSSVDQTPESEEVEREKR